MHNFSRFTLYYRTQTNSLITQNILPVAIVKSVTDLFEFLLITTADSSCVAEVVAENYARMKPASERMIQSAPVL